jgi:hypothetical protein
MKAFLTIVLLLAFGAGVWGNTPEQIAEWKEAAENGEAWAQLKLGITYDTGDGVPEDHKEAVKWFKKAAQQGACCAYTPEVVAGWKERAENGEALAQTFLGDTYDNGNVVPEDKKEAVRWYRKAAEQGHAKAQWSLGGAYFIGNSVIEDYIQAYAWYNIAAANGNELAKEGKTTVAELMTKEQIAKAQDLSREMIEANPKLMGD